MTLEEVCEKYEVAESTMKNNFPRVQKAILKKYNVKIIKEGRGAAARYIEEYETDNRADTMYDELKDEIIINNESLKMMNWDFMVFLAIVTTPMLVFRGSYEDFLRYVDCPVTKANIQELKKTLRSFAQRDLVNYVIDRTNINYFIVALYKQVEDDMKIGIEMVRTCKQLAAKYKKRSWVPLLKVWLGVQLLAETQPYTLKELAAITGLSEYQIKDSSKILRESEIFKTSRAYAGYQQCLGTKVDMNNKAFYLI